MRTLTCLVLALLLTGVSLAQSPEQPVGWRNDSTGRFPQATPPLRWGQLSKPMADLSCQAGRPADAKSGEAIADGVIRQWLVLGPVPMPDVAKAIEQETIPGEARLSPAAEGEMTAGLPWKLVSLDTAWLHFSPLFPQAKKSFAYAHTYLYSQTGGPFIIALTHTGPTALWVNGKRFNADDNASRAYVTLDKGWNHILLKVQQSEEWYADPLISAQSEEYDKSNILWRTLLPSGRGISSGAGAPIVIGDKIFLQCEPHELICLRKSDGQILWVRHNNYLDALKAEQIQADPALQAAQEIAGKLRPLVESLANGFDQAKLAEKAKLEKELFDALKKSADKQFRPPLIPDVGYAGFTPTSDGQGIYAWYGSGLMTCYDLDGKRLWSTLDNHPHIEHGYSTSPLLLDGKLIVYMRDIVAFDPNTGQILWRQDFSKTASEYDPARFHGSFAPATIGKTKVFMVPNGSIVRAADGATLFKDQRMAMQQEIPSPVLDAGVFYKMTTYPQTLYMVRLPESLDGDKLKPQSIQAVKIPMQEFPKYHVDWHTASPLVHDGLVYVLNNAGVLSVVDARSQQVVYQKLLDLDQFQYANEGAARGIGISPVFAGGRIYLFGNTGAALVLEPGRTYKPLAKNKLELVHMGEWWPRQERFVANPFFDGSRIYWRGEGGLWCIGEK